MSQKNVNQSSSHEDKIPFFKTFMGGEVRYGFWNLVSKAFGFGNAFLTISSLTIYQYGVFQLFLTSYAFLAEIINLGGTVVANDVSRFIGTGQEEKAKKLFLEYNRFRFILGILLWLAVFFGSDLLALRYDSEFLSIIKITSLLLISELFFAIFKSLLKIRFDFKAVASRTALAKGSQLIVLLYFLLTSSVNLKAVVIALVFSGWTSVIFLLPAFIRACKPWSSIKSYAEPLLIKVFKKYGKWEIYKNLVNHLSFRIQPWLTKIFINTEAVAIYSVAVSISDAFKNLLTTKTLGSLIPRMIEDRDRVRNIFIYGSKYIVLVSIGLALIAAGLGSAGVYVFFEQYTPSLPLFYLLLIIFPSEVFVQMLDIYLVALRAQRFSFFRMIARNTLSMILLLILLPVVKIWGLAFHDILISIFLLVFSYRYLIKIMPNYRLQLAFFATISERDKVFLSFFSNNFKNVLQEILPIFKVFIRHKPQKK